MEVLRIGNYLPNEFLADTNKKFFLCIKNKGRFPRLEFDLFSLFRLAKEKYNDEHRYTFYRTADVWSANFFT